VGPDAVYSTSHPPDRQHAVVIGAGIAGLVASRALSAHFRSVTLLDRDQEPAQPVARAGVPQGRHIHVVLPGGVRALDRLFPGRLAELVRAGSQPFDYGQSQFHMCGQWMPRIATELYSLAQTRPFLEEHLRRWVRELPNVRAIFGANVTAPILEGSRVTGVALQYAGGDRPEKLRADLVIDATGRHTRLPGWLALHGDPEGYPPVPETAVGIDLGYATGRFRAPGNLRHTHPMLYIVGHPPRETRVGVRVLVEDGVIFGGMGGYHGDHPPADLPGFLEFARSLCQPDIFAVLSQCELLSPIAVYRIPTATRRHYGRMARFPNGILPIGDAICSFDPAFGQGMTVAALEAEALMDCLQSHGRADEAFRRDYFRRADAAVEVPWALSSGENFKYPQTTGRRPLSFPLTRLYKDRLATCGNAVVIHDFYRVVSLSAPPRILLRPRVVARMLGMWR
jgi:2-polyprenyl-6-methoxyphenol hydroxylase-like FAD-dependent oxidoreductase